MKKKYISWILLKKASGVPFYEIHIFYKKNFSIAVEYMPFPLLISQRIKYNFLYFWESSPIIGVQNTASVRLKASIFKRVKM